MILWCLLVPLNMYFVKEKKVIKDKTLNVQILFDVSLSMTADDIKPSRFTAAKESLIKLTNQLSWYNISMITFSGIPLIRMPFSNDTSAIVSKLNDFNMWEFPPTYNFVGTAIGDAIMLGADNLLQFAQNNKPWIIILITDWDSNKGSEPMQAVAFAKKNNIPIYTLWVWNWDFVVGTDGFGNPVNTTINLDLLKSISQNSNGKFYRVLNENEFMQIFNDISSIIKSQEIDKFYYEYFYLNQFLYKFLFVLLVIYIITRIRVIEGLFKKV